MLLDLADKKYETAFIAVIDQTEAMVAFFYAVKVGVSALLIVLISELAKRSSVLAALLASLPLVSLLQETS